MCAASNGLGYGLRRLKGPVPIGGNLSNKVPNERESIKVRNQDILGRKADELNGGNSKDNSTPKLEKGSFVL